MVLLSISFTGYSDKLPEDHWEQDKKDIIYKNQEWVEDKEDIQYKEKKEEEQRTKPAKEEKKIEPSNSNFKLPMLNMWVLYGIVLIALLAVIAYLLKNYTLPHKMTKDGGISYQHDENIEEKLLETDIDRLVRLAIEQGNYQLAIRYTFLKTLKFFVERNRLNWKKQYTNRDYLVQLYQTPYYDSFKNITLIYERKWYRDDASTQEEFEMYRDSCSQLNKSI